MISHEADKKSKPAMALLQVGIKHASYWPGEVRALRNSTMVEGASSRAGRPINRDKTHSPVAGDPKTRSESHSIDNPILLHQGLFPNSNGPSVLR